jgi:hypothetical protein
MSAQNKGGAALPFEQIPEYPETYSPENLVVRMIDGLGYRYFWATEGLRDETLPYRPSPDSRSVLELLRHIYALSGVLLNSAKEIPNEGPSGETIDDLPSLRGQTLQNLGEARLLFAASRNLAAHKVIFKSKDGTAEFPFWNQVNGALEDAVWHSGQVAMLRRAAGNPMAPGVNPFLGITKK